MTEDSLGILSQQLNMLSTTMLVVNNNLIVKLIIKLSFQFVTHAAIILKVWFSV